MKHSIRKSSFLAVGIGVFALLIPLQSIASISGKTEIPPTEPNMANISASEPQNTSSQSKTTAETTAKTSAIIPNVPQVPQNPELPRGCEVTSLTMLLNYAGVKVDKMELAQQIQEVDFKQDGLKGNMNEGFVGDMYSFDNPGLGVFSGPVYQLGLAYLPESLTNLTGSDMTDLYRMIDQGSPVWVLTNTSFKLLPDKEFETWQTNQGTMKVTYHQHSVVMTGYDDQYVYINDPMDTEPNKKVNRADFEQAWEQMGRQAISYVQNDKISTNG
jgi:uncharacterized protein YvpB